MLPFKRETCHDEAFGELRLESCDNSLGMWDGSVAFHHELTRATTLTIYIDAGDGQPTEDQRTLFTEIVVRYPSMWTDIAAKLAANHPQLKTIESITQHVDDPILLSDPVVPGEPFTWTFDEESYNKNSYGFVCSFIVHYSEWKIVGVDIEEFD